MEIKQLSAWYDLDVPILKKINLAIDHNEVLGLIGNNGSGKTTLIKTMSSIHKKYKVKSFLSNDQRCSFEAEAFKLQRIIVFTEDDSFRYWNFEDYLDFLFKSYQKEIDTMYLNYLIDGFSFKKYANYEKRNLSLGNKKKFCLIAAFALKLPLLILDEPVDGLDFESTQFLYEAIKNYKKYGSVFMSTHIFESVKEACDKVVLLKDGTLSKKHKINDSDKLIDFIKGEFHD